MPVAVVTGCSGFVGAELCKQLIERGFTVRGTVRSINSARSKELVTALKATDSQLSLFQADLLTPGSFDAILEGADYLFHVASPFAIIVDDQQRDLVDPAVKGTRNVLLAAAKHKGGSLKRIVLTSSVAAVHDCHERQVPKRVDGKWSEEDFNETSTFEGNPPEGYWVSKVKAEKEAWALASDHGLDLVTILPEFIMGPALTRAAAETSLSAGFFKGFLEGNIPDGNWLISDVRDVATAHILAAITPHASGRYIVSQPSSLSAHSFTDILKDHLKLPIPDGKDALPKSNIDNTKVKELGLQLTPAVSTIKDMADALIALGFANKST